MAEDYTIQYTAEEINNRLGRPVPVNQGGTGQTAKYQSVTVSANASNISDANFTCRYYPFLGVVFFRGNGTLSSATTINTWFEIASIPSEYRPRQSISIAVSVPGGGSGLARYTGSIEMRTFTARAANTAVDFSGWWFV